MACSISKLDCYGVPSSILLRLRRRVPLFWYFYDLITQAVVNSLSWQRTKHFIMAHSTEISTRYTTSTAHLLALQQSTRTPLKCSSLVRLLFSELSLIGSCLSGTGTLAGPFLYTAIYSDLHILTVYLWVALRLCQAIDAHSGYGVYIAVTIVPMLKLELRLPMVSSTYISPLVWCGPSRLSPHGVCEQLLHIIPLPRLLVRH